VPETLDGEWSMAPPLPIKKEQRKMENKYRNEMEISLGGEKILLRPTFENIAAMESNVGSVAWLTWRYSRGVRFKDGKVDKSTMASEAAIKALPALSETAQIIYYNQAALNPNDPTQKKFSLEEIWALVMGEGAKITSQVVIYLGRITAGNKSEDITELKDLTEAEKKS